MSSQNIHFDAIEDPLEKLEAIGRLSTPSPTVSVPDSADNFTIQSNLDSLDVEEDDGIADQALALELFDLINHEDIWKIATLQSQVYVQVEPFIWPLPSSMTKAIDFSMLIFFVL